MNTNPRRGHPLGLGMVLAMSLLTPGHAEQTKPFPGHWGEPPAIQTRDYVVWPDGYGQGSSTVAHWIEQNMARDASGGAPSTALLYAMDFEGVDVGGLPDDFMVLNGEFSVQEDGAQKFLQLPGAPIENFAVLFGPAGGEDREVSVQIQASSKGRRYPAFAVGLNGLGGYRLKVVPARRLLELWRGPDEGGERVDEAAFSWKSGEWTTLTLRLRKTADSEWHVEGRAWTDGTPEPGDWSVSHVDTKQPLPGRPLVAASPYSGTVIRFDDLSVSKVLTGDP